MNTHIFKKTAGWTLLLSASALLLSSCHSQSKAEQRSAAAPIPVVVETVKAQNLPLWQYFTGRVSAVRKATVVARAGGTVQAIFFKQGGQVKADQALFQIDPAPYQAVVDRAKAAYRNSQSLYQRVQKLYKSKAVSAQELDNAQAKAQADEAQLRTAQINLAYTRVPSPISGVISRAYVTVGQLVSPQAASPMATIIDPSEMYVDFAESSDQLLHEQALLKGGQFVLDPQLRLSLNGAQIQVSGKLLLRGNEVNPMTGQVPLRALFQNPQGVLLDGMAVDVQFKRGEYQQIIALPAQAVMIANTPEGAQHYVFVVDEHNRIEKRVIQVGDLIGQQIRVTQGLSVGDRVVTEGINKVYPSIQVAPQTAQ